MRDTPHTLAAAAIVTAALVLPTAAMADPVMERAIIAGAIADPADTDTTADTADAAIPLLPVVSDDDSQSNTQANSETGARGAHS